MTDTTTPRASGLRYATGEDVRLGDRVDFRSLVLRRPRRGTVVCIPPLTGRELHAQGKTPDDWLIRLDSGGITGWLYSPEDLQPPGRLVLLARADGPVEEVTNAQVDELERLEEEKAGWFELLLPPLVLAAIGAGVVALLVWMFH